jgi:hypothetical protein
MEKQQGHGLGWKSRVALDMTASVAIMFGGAYLANEHPDDAADILRSTFGVENTTKIEGRVFAIKDKKNQLKDRIIGSDKNPFEEDGLTMYITTEPQDIPLVELAPSNPYDIFVFPQIEGFIPEPAPKPKLMALPETNLILSPQTGEGQWTARGLPLSTENDYIMAKTFIRPDKERPYASVSILKLDKRYVKLHMVGGTEEPGPGGTGKIPEEDLESLLVAFAGGFKEVHGHFGMVVDGKVIRPLRTGVASVVIMNDGEVKIGTWEDGTLPSDTTQMRAVRQNAFLLVENGKVTPNAIGKKGEDGSLWGYVAINDTGPFITQRSAIALDEFGNIMIASGKDVSAGTLALGLQAAGAKVAMQLEINSPYVQTDLFTKKKDGTLEATHFRDGYENSPKKYLNSQKRDFMYFTLDETNYKPE